jgi:hypothetical protein
MGHPAYVRKAPFGLIRPIRVFTEPSPGGRGTRHPVVIRAAYERGMTTLDPQPYVRSRRVRVLGPVLLKLLVAAVVTVAVGELMTPVA